MREGLQKIISLDETIVAISTALGRSGIGVVRISGKEALAIAERFFKPHGRNLKHRLAHIGDWLEAGGTRIDEVVVTAFRAPESYTGEDVVEISAHGNPLILSGIVETACSASARVASPGEFTLRAVANGKLDLIQAEAVRDFIEAQTEQQAKSALRQLEGSVSNRLRPVRDSLVDVIARLEAGIDFAEDDIEVPSNAAILETLRRQLDFLDRLQETFAYGRKLTRGLQLVILGKPNVGKSSLFNRLVAADRAIVTEVPGTTRDVLCETVSIDGVPLRFADTAGVHQTSDPVEKIGVTRTLEALSDADLAFAVLDGSRPLDNEDTQVLASAKKTHHLIIVNKSDLWQVADLASLNGSDRIHVSAKTGEGVGQLREAVRKFLASERTDLADDVILTNTRQNATIVKAVKAVQSAIAALVQNIPHEMVLLDLYAAVSALGEMTGEVVTEDILDRIFSTFCVGK